MVFLTIGHTMFKQQQNEALLRMGIAFKLPGGLHSAVAESAVRATRMYPACAMELYASMRLMLDC